ncbi:hypothetical protein PR048_011662 [Dryococelus australis]|uniref:Uncharacterized protein n=1 Tax=Dryococelus australis TaxID=614101 RepID=A0ABQ9HM63_9NEOP|nr:hypothetical protein PR048_011662 [Dryococelus australis]
MLSAVRPTTVKGYVVEETDCEQYDQFLAGHAGVHPLYAAETVTRRRRLPVASQQLFSRHVVEQISVVFVDECVLAWVQSPTVYYRAPFVDRFAELFRICRGAASRALASHFGETGSILGGVTPGFSHVGIVLDDAAVFGGFSRGSPVSPALCIPALLHSHLTSPSSAVKTPMLRANEISHERLFVELPNRFHTVPQYDFIQMPATVDMMSALDVSAYCNVGCTRYHRSFKSTWSMPRSPSSNMAAKIAYKTEMAYG